MNNNEFNDRIKMGLFYAELRFLRSMHFRSKRYMIFAHFLSVVYPAA